MSRQAEIDAIAARTGRRQLPVYPRQAGDEPATSRHNPSNPDPEPTEEEEWDDDDDD